ncbi:LysR substrate-binding domain-containing protein (plasmid) [Rhizobium johnstonii]|nr:LysR substrate-binding domain-containing protein [Rhizobium johnstonii]
MQSLDRAGVTPAIVDEVYRIVAAINLVAGGRGVTIVPASMQVLHPEAIAYRALAPGQLSPLPLCIAYRRDLKLSIVRNFVALTKEIAAIPPHTRDRA